MRELVAWLLAQPIAWVAAVVGWYATACRTWPWGSCWRCKGTGKLGAWGSDDKPRRRRHFRKCPRCRGTGIRLRIGRRIFNHLHTARGKAQS